ncbi:MAG: glycosyltransferase family 39 protein [Lentimicrobiaceae bacterium]|nr:glycosyltransferase family 39 protein [Lentimicrobiaceae bacterium]
MISVIFSKGFGMHDDHFLIIEVSQSWVDGTNFNNWLPGSQGAVPSGHSFFYTSLHFLLFLFLKIIGITDPQTKMFIVRFLHALLSLLSVYMGYRITEKIDGKEIARKVGLLFAVFWIMPWLSVRNLVEVVCIPFLLTGSYILLKAEDRQNRMLWYVWAGMIFGLAFSIRFQTIIFSLGVGLALLFQKKWKEGILFGLAYLFLASLVQCVTDIYFWGYPFAEVKEYIRYNMDNAYNYMTAGWYMYLLLILLVLIPPISILLFIGFFRTWKKHLLLFLPTLLFIVFHSYFPNKQERFILPILPYFFILGMVGLNGWVKSAAFWQKRQLLLRRCWTLFWIVNLVLLPVVSTMYSKRSRVESMVYLSQYKGMKDILLEDTNHGRAKRAPRFYLTQWVTLHEFSKDKRYHPLKKIYPDSTERPDFILFFGDKNLNTRIDSIKTICPNLEFEATIHPSFMDDLMYRLNPINSNQTIFIYRNIDRMGKKTEQL